MGCNLHHVGYAGGIDGARGCRFRHAARKCGSCATRYGVIDMHAIIEGPPETAEPTSGSKSDGDEESQARAR